MADEMEFVYATQVDVGGSDGSLGSGAFSSTEGTALASPNHYDYPMADFVLTCVFAAAVAAGAVVNLYRQDLEILPGQTAPLPSATYKHTHVGVFPVHSLGAIYPCNDVPLSKNCRFFIENATTQTLAADWDLLATPKTFKPGA